MTKNEIKKMAIKKGFYSFALDEENKTFRLPIDREIKGCGSAGSTDYFCFIKNDYEKHRN